MHVPVNRKPSGFTLVEMAIVLVIIGIILAGVMKGRDIVRGSQVKAFTQQFAQKWQTVAQTYYDKTGQFFNDGDGNGNGNVAGSGTDAPNGQMDGGLGALLTTEAGAETGNGPVATLESVGITPCTLIKSKYNQTVVGPATGGNVIASCIDTANVGVNIGCTQVEGEYSGVQIVEADLVYLVITPAVGPVQNRNCAVFYMVPTDVAIGMDTAIDGSVSGNSGAVLNLEDTAQGATNPGTVLAVGDPATAAPWPSASAGGMQTVAIVLDF